MSKIHTSRLKQLTGKAMCFIVLLYAIGACKETVHSSLSWTKDTDIQLSEIKYIDSIVQWKNKRVAALKAQDGWLNLIGLFWLHQGKNTIGSTKGHDIIFPKNKSSRDIGHFRLTNEGVITFYASQGVTVRANNVPVKEITVYPSKETIILSHNTLQWFIIKRGNSFAVRVRDLNNELVDKFTGTASFPIDSNWRVRAKFQPVPLRTIPINDVTDRTSEQNSPGTLYFTIGEKEFHLDVLREGSKFFIVFGDQTNGMETYHTGRFLYADTPNKAGYTWLDFNKAYNPPCAFTAFATCPIPPKQNILTIPITAGEKKYKELGYSKDQIEVNKDFNIHF